MQAVILCGGQGKNLSPLTESIPHSLLGITGKSIIEHILDRLIQAGFTESTLAIGYLGNMIVNNIGDNYNGMTIHYTKACTDGTAKALSEAYSNDDMLVIEANSIFDFDLNKIIDFHKSSKSPVTAVVTNHELDNSYSDSAFTGIYVLSKEIFYKYDFKNNKDFIKDILPEATRSKECVKLYNITGYYKKFQSISDWFECQRDVLDGLFDIKINSTICNNGIYSDTDSNFNGVSIVPPVYIGQNVTIQPGAIIGEHSVIDDNAIIESRSEILRSYIGENSVVKSNSRIISSIVCGNVFLGRNVCCNENSVIGEKSEIGQDSTIENNVKIWPKTKIREGSVIKGNVRSGTGSTFKIDEDCCCNFHSNQKLPSEITELGMAIGTAIDKSNIVIVGCAQSNSAKILSEALTAGLISAGVEVYDISSCNSQQLMLASEKLSARIGCYVYSEHSVKIKLISGSGLPLSSELERKIENSYNSSSYRAVQPAEYSIPRNFSGATELYKRFVNSLLPNKFNGLNAQIKSTDPITTAICDDIIRSKNDVDGERIIFHISEDGSACSAYNERTEYIFHERLILLAVKIYSEKNIPVSIPYSFPFAPNFPEEHEKSNIYRYSINSYSKDNRYAIEIARRPENLFIHDGLMLCCVICEHLSRNHMTLHEALKDIPMLSSVKRYIRASKKSLDLLKKINCKKSNSAEEIVYENENSKAKIKTLKNGMGLIIQAESRKAEFASAICDEIQEKLRKYENNILN